MPYKDLDKRKAWEKEYRQTHREIKRKNDKKYKQSHIVQLKERRKKYLSSHPEQMRKDYRTRRARKRAVCEYYTAQDELFTLCLFNYQCFNCGSKDNLTIDHVYPLSKGYALDRSNACVLCHYCNSSKNDLMPEEFYHTDELQELFTLLGIDDPPTPILFSQPDCGPAMVELVEAIIQATSPLPKTGSSRGILRSTL